MLLINYIKRIFNWSLEKFRAFRSIIFPQIPTVTIEQNIYYICLFGDYNELTKCLNGEYQPGVAYPSHLSNYFLSFFPQLQHYCYKNKRIEYIHTILLHYIDNNLCAALQGNNPNIINLLLTKLTFDNMMECLKRAVQNNKQNIIIFLRLKISALDADRAIAYAINDNNHELIKCLFNVIDINIIYKHLKIFVRNNNVVAIKSLISKMDQDIIDTLFKYAIEHENYDLIDVFLDSASPRCIADLISKAIETKNKIVINALASKIPESFAPEFFAALEYMQEKEFKEFITEVSALFIFKSFNSVKHVHNSIKKLVEMMPYSVVETLLQLSQERNALELIELFSDRLEEIVFTESIQEYYEKNTLESILSLGDRISNVVLSTKIKDRVLYFFSRLIPIMQEHAGSDIHNENPFSYDIYSKSFTCEAFKDIRFLTVSCILLEDALQNNKSSIINLILPKMTYLHEVAYDKHGYIPKILLLAVKQKNLETIISFSNGLAKNETIDEAYNLSCDLNFSDSAKALLPNVSDMFALKILNKAAATGDTEGVAVLSCRTFPLKEISKIIDAALHNSMFQIVEILIRKNDLDSYFYQKLNEGFTTNEKINDVVLSWKKKPGWALPELQKMLNILIQTCGYHGPKDDLSKITLALVKFTEQHNCIEKLRYAYSATNNINQRINSYFFRSIESEHPENLAEHASYFYKNLFKKTVKDLRVTYDKLLTDSGLKCFKHNRAYIENHLSPEQLVSSNKKTKTDLFYEMLLQPPDGSYVSDVCHFEVIRTVRVLHLRNVIKIFMAEDFYIDYDLHQGIINTDLKVLRRQLSENLSQMLGAYWDDELREAFALLKLHSTEVYGDLYNMSTSQLLTGFIERNIGERVYEKLAKTSKTEFIGRYRI